MTWGDNDNDVRNTWIMLVVVTLVAILLSLAANVGLIALYAWVAKVVWQ